MHKLLFFAFSVCFLSTRLFAQSTCGTDTRHTLQLDYAQVEAYGNKISQARLEADTVYLPLQIHIVKSSTGVQADEAAILQSIKVVNNRFRPLGIQFVLCSTFLYITSDAFTSLDDADETDKLITTYNNPQTID